MPSRPTSELTVGAFFDEAPCGLLVLAPDWRIRRVNAALCAWTGRPAAELEGLHLRDLLDVAGRIFFDTHFAPLVRLQGAFHEVALTLKGADGARIPVLVNAAERLGPDDAVEAMLVTVLNATDRRRYEEELLTTRDELRDLNETLERRVAEEVERRLAAEEGLRQAQKMEAIGNLSAGIAHDFNNVLQIVSANLDLAAKRADAAGAGFVDKARAGVERGARLAQQLLTMGRRKSVESRAIDAVGAIRGLRDMIERGIHGSGTLSLSLPDAPVPVEVDVAQFENALLNLAINARDAMEARPGTVGIALRAMPEGAPGRPAGLSGPLAELRVSDEGSGMAPEIVAKVFEPFFTTKPAGKGTGMGLAMVHGFATGAGGTVTIDSAPGRGTAVSIWLPLSNAVPESSEDTPQPDAPGGTETVLLIEDDAAVRDAITALLADLGYGVLHAEGAAEARAHLSGPVAPDLILTDLALRGDESGLDLVRAFVAEGHRGGVLLTSGRTDEFSGDADRAFELLRKPYDRSALASALRRALGAAIPPPPRPREAPAQAAAPRGLRVLLVEDDFLIRDTAAGQLSDLGHEPIEAESAEEALDLLSRHEIDVLMTDLGLPGMDGAALARRVRRLAPEIGIVFATGASAVPTLEGRPAVRLDKPDRDHLLVRALAEARGA